MDVNARRTRLLAIPTKYDGYTFRSRLEARWAYFFKNAGIDYEYEPETFDLDGIWYIPDFRIRAPFFYFRDDKLVWGKSTHPNPDNAVYVECKHYLHNLTAKERTKIYRFSEASASGILLLKGDPYKYSGTVLITTKDGGGLKLQPGLIEADVKIFRAGDMAGDMVGFLVMQSKNRENGKYIDHIPLSHIGPTKRIFTKDEFIEIVDNSCLELRSRAREKRFF